MAARYQDAQAGWQLYKQAGYDLTRREINLRLGRQGYRPISARTFSHYEKLRRYGYRRYLPINQLDVKTLRDPLWDEATRQRYLERPVVIPVDLHLWSDDGLITLEAVLIEASDASAVAEATSVLPPSLVVGKMLVVDFRRVGVEQLARVRSIEDEPGASHLLLDFTSLASIDVLAARPILAEGSLTISVPAEGRTAYLGDTVRSLYWLFQAAEAARVVCDDVLAVQDPEGRYASKPPTLVRLSVGSPLDISLLGSVTWIALVVFSISQVLSWRREYHEGTVAKESTRKLRLENDRAQVESRFNIPLLVTRLARETADLLRQLGTEPRTADPDQRRIEGLIRRQLLPSVMGFLEEAGDDLHVTASAGTPDLGGESPPTAEEAAANST